MTDKKSIDSRRKLLKSIAAGSGAVVAGKTLPEAWTKPVVDSVLLPAHATTSGELQFYADITEYAPSSGVKNALLCVTVTGNNYIGKLAMTYGEEGIEIFNSPSTPLGTVSDMTGTCSDEGGGFLATNLTANSIDYGFSKIVSSLPLASCSLPAANCIPMQKNAAQLEEKTNDMDW